MPACSSSWYVVFNMFRWRLCYVIFIPVVGARFSSKGDKLWLVSPNTKGENLLTPRMKCVQKIREQILRWIKEGLTWKLPNLHHAGTTSMEYNLLEGLDHSCYLHIVNRNWRTRPANLSIVITNRPPSRVNTTHLDLLQRITFLLPKQSGLRKRSLWKK